MIRSIISDQISMDFEEALYKAKEYFQYVEIHSLWNKAVEELNDDELTRVENLLKKYKIHVSCLSTTLFLMCPLYTDVKSLEKFGDNFLVFIGDIEDHTNCLKKCIEISERFSTDYIRIFPFRLEKNVLKGYTNYFTDIREKLGDAVTIAEKGRKCLILENCPHTYLPRGYMTYELANTISSESFGLLYDVGNSYRSMIQPYPEEFKRGTLVDEYIRIKGRVRYLHSLLYRILLHC